MFRTRLRYGSCDVLTHESAMDVQCAYTHARNVNCLGWGIAGMTETFLLVSFYLKRVSFLVDMTSNKPLLSLSG